MELEHCCRDARYCRDHGHASPEANDYVVWSNTALVARAGAHQFFSLYSHRAGTLALRASDLSTATYLGRNWSALEVDVRVGFMVSFEFHSCLESLLWHRA